jgi:glycosyltransferase involved in cell wall biosynthesis
MVVRPGDSAAFLAAAEKLLEDEPLREELARRARAYAEKAFDVDTAASRFEEVLERARSASP